MTNDSFPEKDNRQETDYGGSSYDDPHEIIVYSPSSYSYGRPTGEKEQVKQPRISSGEVVQPPIFTDHESDLPPLPLNIRYVQSRVQPAEREENLVKPARFGLYWGIFWRTFLGISFSGAVCGGIYAVIVLFGFAIFYHSSSGSYQYQYEYGSLIFPAVLYGGVLGGIAGGILAFISGVFSLFIAAFTVNIENYGRNVTIGNVIIGGLILLGAVLFIGNSLTGMGSDGLLAFTFLFVVPSMIATGVMILLGRLIGGWYRGHLFYLTR